MLTWIKWIKEFFGIVGIHDRAIEALTKEIKNAEFRYAALSRQVTEAVQLIRERTDISTDLHQIQSTPNQIIITGRYKKRDYVNVFSLQNKEMEHLIHQLRDMQKYGIINSIDAPYPLNRVIKHDLGNW